METTDLYLAIRVMTLPTVLALATGEAPKFKDAGWKTATPTAPTLKAPAPKTV